MKADTEHFLKHVTKTRNQTGKRGKLIEKQTRFLTAKERKNRQGEKDWIDSILSQPPWVLKDMTQDRRADLTRRRNYLEEDLEDNSPPTDISPETKDALYKFQKELEERIRSGMPTAEAMRRNPPGAVDAHMRWEKTNKDQIITWKNVKRLLDPENEEKDYTNVETLRPSGLSPETIASSFMVNAQIPGVFGMTRLAKANWPESMPEHGTVDTPMKQAERRELVEEMVSTGVVPEDRVAQLEAEIKKLQQRLAEKEVRKTVKRKLTEEQRKAVGERLAAARKAKKHSQGEAANASPQEG